MNITFTMIKPETVKDKLTGNIISDIEMNGFTIKAIKKVHMTLDDAHKFYEIHKSQVWYEETCQMMSSGPVVAMLLESDSENIVSEFRELIGNTDPTKANFGTIRRKYGKSKGSNASHASDSKENAQIEAKFFDLI